jgi:hypothetical protein
MARGKRGRHECDHGASVIGIYLTEGIGDSMVVFDAMLISFKDSWASEVAARGRVPTPRAQRFLRYFVTGSGRLPDGAVSTAA